MMGLAGISKQVESVHFLKISLLVQIGEEI